MDTTKIDIVTATGSAIGTTTLASPVKQGPDRRRWRSLTGPAWCPMDPVDPRVLNVSRRPDPALGTAIPGLDGAI